MGALGGPVDGAGNDNPAWGEDLTPAPLTAPLLPPPSASPHPSPIDPSLERGRWVDGPPKSRRPPQEPTWVQEHCEDMLSMGAAPGGFWGDWKPHIFTYSAPTTFAPLQMLLTAGRVSVESL